MCRNNLTGGQIAFQFGKTGNKKRATRFATMMQNGSLNFSRLLRVVFSSQQRNKYV